MAHRLAAPHPLRNAVRLHALERQLEGDVELVAAFVAAGWARPRTRGKRWYVLLLVMAMLAVGFAVSPLGGGRAGTCVPPHRSTVSLAHAYDRPCS
jgi:hypothetical protein